MTMYELFTIGALTIAFVLTVLVVEAILAYPNTSRLNICPKCGHIFNEDPNTKSE
jgi:hypothetical protein